jgi:hypothetical protein
MVAASPPFITLAKDASQITGYHQCSSTQYSLHLPHVTVFAEKAQTQCQATIRVRKPVSLSLTGCLKSKDHRYRSQAGIVDSVLFHSDSSSLVESSTGQ